MKTALLLLSLALFMALFSGVYTCDPDGNNQPDCRNSTNLQVKIRNFWDPTRFWWCASVGSQAAVAITCEDDAGEPTGFDTTLRTCVPWKNWTWTWPCA
ncbi:uncharacterized protein LOC128261671 [Drosophila gunungcola]|uniref:uncharacterized protein LOC128261671 n=1 Tax=Drosophila gunungcola TaxID=103775 RepID=UPI0022E200CE|nr:uncharacterized protein LOC128261671 [Drosophila gunungcola]